MASQTAQLLAPPQIGPYRLLDCLGAGAMGVVYRARRVDGLYAKDVALKRVRVPDPELARRLLREREILGALSHPGIASLLDGGYDAEGVPYLVLEYIDGVTLGDWARREQPGVRAIVQLAIGILQALAYAHARLVVHRDLKPGNVLVDQHGAPKLVDFGIARALDGAPAHTAISFTPEYAAPEQLGSEAPTALSDLYSFGVVLYELLTGDLPYTPAQHEIWSWAQAIQTQEPVRPSLRASDPARQRALRGDLDAVLLKALDKDPARRYQSAQALAEELQRYLDGFPVQAQAPGWQLRLRKYVRRHRVLVSAIGLSVLALLGGAGVALWQSRVASAERDQALRDRARAEAVSGFLQRMLSYSNPLVGTHPNPGDTRLSEVLDEWARRVDAGDFDAEPAVHAELLRVLSQSFGSQGQYDRQRWYAQQWAELARSALADDPGQLLLAQAELAALAFVRQDLNGALDRYRALLPQLRQALADGLLSPAQVITPLNNFAYLRRTQGDSAEAEAAFRESLALGQGLPEGQHDLIATVRSTLASTIGDQGRFDEALATAGDAVAEFVGRPARERSADFGFALNVHAGFLIEAGDYALADRELTRAEGLLRARLGPQHLWLGDNLRNQGLLALARQEWARASRAAEEARAIYEASFGEQYDHYPTVLLIQAAVAAHQGDVAGADALYQRALALRSRLLPEGHYFTAIAQSQYAGFLADQGRVGEARALLQRAVADLIRSQGVGHPRTRAAQQRLQALGTRAEG
ncbi:MAG: serine/threonine-protein kinase [Lysobacterales bacterium]